MSTHFKAKNFFAILIAIALIAIGFVLGFINKQTTSANEHVPAQHEDPVIVTVSSPGDKLSQVATIHDKHKAPKQDKPVKSELERIRDSIDWSDAPTPAPELVKTDDYDVYVNVTKEYLAYIFDKVGYTGDKIDSGETVAIPPLLVVSITKGWSDNETVLFKKSMFFRVILALVLYENDAVLRDRSSILDMLDSRNDHGSFSAEQASYLNQLAKSYRVIPEATQEPLSEDQIQELLTRVDMVPPSLALAQAAHESGYATSRFAYTGNALFGQWDWGKDTIKPKQQRGGMGNYGIKSFDQPIDSVRAYIWNLNTHRAYAGFRAERAAQRGDRPGRISMDSKKLADTLTAYSERGTAYTDELKATISYNRLERADGLRLMEGEPVYFH